MPKLLPVLAMKKWMLVAAQLRNSRISFKTHISFKSHISFKANLRGCFSCFFFFLSSFCIFLCSAAFDKAVFAEDLSRKIDSLLDSESGFSLIDLKSSKQILSVNSEVNYKPASTLKLLTSISALKELGHDFTFKTKVFASKNKNEEVTLAIEGGSDPEFTTEQAYLLVRRLKLAGLYNIKKLILHSNSFQEVKGQRAYQAASSSLSFNFNSSGVQICPNAEVNKKAEIAALVWEDSIKLINNVKTTTTNLPAISMQYKGKDAIEVSGSVPLNSRCLARYLINQDPINSLANFLKSNIESLGLGEDIKLSFGSVPENASLVFEFESQPLSQILEGLNHFSTNVSAEQILAALGQEGENQNFSRENGILKEEALLRDLNIDEFRIEDGSGLSHSNKISAHAISSLLAYAYQNFQIRPYLERSLPIFGESGTLKKRRATDSGYLVAAKSGTLDEVSSLAGYLYLKDSRTYAFSIMQNGVADLEKAHRIEELILETLAKNL